MGSIIGIALKGFGKALRKDKSTPIRSVKPKAGLEETKAYKEKIKAKQTNHLWQGWNISLKQKMRRV
jgi:hypothetical protein